MLQRLQTALAKVKAYNKSANLLNKIRQIIHSLHDEKKLYKYNTNIIQNGYSIYEL